MNRYISTDCMTLFATWYACQLRILASVQLQHMVEVNAVLHHGCRRPILLLAFGIRRHTC
jgi:hypothetical protein